MIPIKIKCDLGKILDGKILAQSDSSNGFVISNITSTEIEIKFTYMDGNDGVKIQILHTCSGGKLNVDCKIKGGKEIRNHSEIKTNKGIKGFERGIMDEVIPLIIFWLGFFIAELIAKIMNIQHNAYSLIILILSIFIAVVFIIIYEKMKKRIRKTFHKSVPDLLKNN